MHYIRFLSPPKVVVDKSDITLKTVIAITTDLGETFFPEDLELVATIRESADDGDVYLRRKLQWPAGARALPINFNLSRNDIEWPACLHVYVRQSPPASIDYGGHGFLPPVVDIWSSPLNPTKGHFVSGPRVERRFVSLSERPISLLEDAGDSIARHLWDGSQALCQYIDQLICLQTPSQLPLLEYILVSATYRRLNVLELGCGCGTVGLALAQMIPDCDVILTDLPEVTELVVANVDRLNPAMNSKVSFVPLDWEEPIPARLRSRANDLIVVSECTYNADTLQTLVNTLTAILERSPKAVIVVSTKTRHTSEAAFFGMMQAAGIVQDSSVRVKLPGQPGDGYADWATDVGVHVFHGKGHRLSLSPRESEQDVPRAQRSARRS
ncbi:hypothetical protein AMS68_005573 [Peltaster fructicola]|uniref:Methyltransferase domain-containing protein n=1 Tax=Peltaster fructicola TaxID=286661 RepID=A0A6H0XZE7_9PEZI|nr:hypothetical protein AMS68_005573 [Peltaster fructicola]